MDWVEFLDSDAINDYENEPSVCAAAEIWPSGVAGLELVGRGAQNALDGSGDAYIEQIPEKGGNG